MKEFDILAKHILKHEGGLFISPTEGGGAANRGVTYDTYKGNSMRLLSKAPTWANFVALTPSEAKLFIKDYYNQINGAKIKSQAIALLLTEIAWGSGIGQAGYTVQNVLNKDFDQNLSVDGDIGNKTILAINSVNGNQLYDKILSYRSNWLQQLAQRKPELANFLKGWLNRVNDMRLLKPSLFTKTVGVSLGTFIVGYALYKIISK